MAEEGVFNSIRVTVQFDDGPEVVVPIMQRDFMRLEQQDRDSIDKDGNIRPHHVMVLAWLALSRQKRTKQLDETVPLPDTLDEFMDVVDVDVQDDPAGKAISKAPSTG
jgi:hypothetical protein